MPDTLVPYQAYGLAELPESPIRLEILRWTQDTSFFVEDAHFLEGWTDKKAETAAVIYDKCDLFMYGRNLAQLPMLIEVYGLRFLQCFDPALYLPPAAHEPFIEQIEWQTVFATTSKYQYKPRKQVNLQPAQVIFMTW